MTNRRSSRWQLYDILGVMITAGRVIEDLWLAARVLLGVALLVASVVLWATGGPQWLATLACLVGLFIALPPLIERWGWGRIFRD